MGKRTCTYQNCGRPHDSHDYCSMHARRWRVHGDPGYEPPRLSTDGCAAADCTRKAECIGLYCVMHYKRWKRRGSTASTGRPGRGSKIGPERCGVDGCLRRHDSRGYCQGHYLRYMATGDPGPAELQAKVVHRGRGHRDKSGYVQISVDYAIYGKRWIHEHRLVMEALLGRRLLPGEEVHHRNAIRHDNRPENLELWVKSQPAGARVEDLIEHALYILHRYAPHQLSNSATVEP